MNYRRATQADVPLLARLNRQLIQDEGHRNRMSLAELEQRMSRWLDEEYEAVLFELDDTVLVYALYRLEPDYIYLRQFFVSRDHRRKGIGRRAIRMLQSEVWPGDARIRVEVLVGNDVARNFWKTVGFAEYAIIMETETKA